MGTGGGIFLFVMLVAGCLFLFGLAVEAVICWFLSKWVARIPPAHRKLTPGSVWLLMIPLFSALWVFFVYPRISDSFESYFRSKGERAETGRGMALAYCVLNVVLVPIGAVQLAMDPTLRGRPPALPGGPLLVLQIGGGLLNLAMLVLWILLLVKFHGLKERIPASAPPGPEGGAG